MKTEKEKYNEKEVNDNFQLLLNKFHKLIDGEPKPETIKKELKELQEESNTLVLTGHQRDAIYARCKNYLEGNYGSTSKEHKLHEHVKGSKNG